MTGARRGRPGKSASELRKASILNAALARLEAQPGGQFSMRALAADLSVTPMALYNHIDGIDGLLRALADHVFGRVPDTVDRPAKDAIAELLCWYCGRVLAYPGLTIALIARAPALPQPHQALTRRIKHLSSAAGCNDDWPDILLDHLHGFALSMAAGGAVDRATALATYERQLETLLGAAAQTGSNWLV